MTEAFVGWVICAAFLSLCAIVLGMRAIHRGWLGILIDQRGRFSLTQVQLVLWTIVILSLIGGAFLGRLFGGLRQDSLGFAIPNNLLLVLGISVGSAATTAVIKAQKDTTVPEKVAASHPEVNPPEFAQVFMVEEGAMADQVIDVTKFQNFFITLLLVLAYVAQSAAFIGGLTDIRLLTSLPDFSPNFVTLLGISHAGYIVGKIPSPKGMPAVSMDTVNDQVQTAEALQAAPVVVAGPVPGVNPTDPNRP